MVSPPAPPLRDGPPEGARAGRDGSAPDPGSTGPGGLDIGLAGALLALAWLAGLALQLQQAALPGRGFSLGLLASALVLMGLAWLAWRQRHPLWAVWAMGCVALGLAVLAYASTNLRAQARLDQRLPAALEGQDLVVTGLVASLPRVGASGTAFQFEVESATWHGQALRLPQRLSLGWYREQDAEALAAAAPPQLRAGQRWRLPLRLRQPHGQLNPHGFDRELWLFEQGVGAVGSVAPRPGAGPAKLAEAAGYPVQRARQHLRERIQSQVSDPAAAGVLAALAVGDQAAIERDDWDTFRATGVAHLMSISGLHVTMFAWLAAALLGSLWRRSPRLMRLWPTPFAARWGGLALATAYALLAGWGVPAQRTLCMIAVVALLRSLGLRWPMPWVLLAAAVVVTALDPWALMQAGFWLSFVAVGLLIAAEPSSLSRPAPAGESGWRRFRQRLDAAVRGGIRTQAIATVGLAPLSLLFFQQVSLVGFVANLAAIPLVSLVITPLALLGAVLPPLWSLAAALVQALSALLLWLASWPAAVWTAAAAPPWAVASGLLAAVLAVLPLPWRLRLLCLPLMLPLLVPPVVRPAPGQFEMVAADVGQGTAVLVRTQRHLLVYDSGPAYSPQADAGSLVLLPLLRARGERRIDMLMLSHGDADHVGGAAALLGAMPVGALSSSLPPGHALRSAAVVQQRCDAGQRWHWDGVDFEVMHPLAEDHARSRRSNPLSCVLRIQGAQRSALLSGDIEAAQEAALVARSGAALRSDMLLVPHHGSRSSSTPGFLDAVSPQVAVVQAAYRSRYGHPAPEVLARYAERGISVQRSDVCGAWTGLPDGSQACERDKRRRYWHHVQHGPKAGDSAP